MPTDRTARPAFTLVELAAAVVLVLLVVAVLIPVHARHRAAVELEGCKSNMKRIGVLTAIYSADFAEYMPTFSWQPGETRVLADGEEQELPIRGSSTTWATYQQCAIIAHRGGRVGDPDLPNFVQSHIPHVAYSYLVLVDYAEGTLPDPRYACPSDENLLRWQSDPVAASNGELPPFPQSSAGSGTARLAVTPYRSSYEFTAANWDFGQSDLEWVGGRVQLSSNNSSLRVIPFSGLGPASRSLVRYPSSKVMLMDEFDRHSGAKTIHYGQSDASQPLLFQDGAVRVRLTADSNPGWNPGNIASNSPTTSIYLGTVGQPPEHDWLPTPRGGEDGDPFVGAYAWTRGGNLGIDFGGKEINTGQPD